MYESPAGRAVRSSFKTLVDNPSGFNDDDTALLRDRIHAAVDELRGMGWPIERIIVRVKELAWEVGIRLGQNVSQVDRHPALAQAVRWCVERYYGEKLEASSRR